MREDCSRSIFTGPSATSSRASCDSATASPPGTGRRSAAKRSGDMRRSSLPRTTRGTRRASCMTTPARWPSTSVRKSFCTCSTDNPRRPRAWRSRATRRYCTPSFLVVSTSSLPGRPCSTCTTSSARRESSCAWGPKTFTAKSPRTPESISEVRISIGWVKLRFTPGTASAAARMASMSSSLVLKRHSARGLSTRKLSVSFRPMGSRPNSSEPTRATMRSTSGTCARMRRCSAWSVAADCSRLMEGSFSTCMMMSPSSSDGMNDLPINGNSAKAPANASTAPAPTTRGWRSAASSSGA